MGRHVAPSITGHTFMNYCVVSFTCDLFSILGMQKYIILNKIFIFVSDVTFCKLIVQMWPILSLKKSQQKPKSLVKTIVKNAGKWVLFCFYKIYLIVKCKSM
jgi:hypothetical protein